MKSNLRCFLHIKRVTTPNATSSTHKRINHARIPYSTEEIVKDSPDNNLIIL